ncbi:hypothetical protein [Paenisporosarcina sp. NPDC076898]
MVVVNDVHVGIIGVDVGKIELHVGKIDVHVVKASFCTLGKTRSTPIPS